ncbi:MAG: ABC transporter substrate-binding protein [Actinomycetota bacterium]
MHALIDRRTFLRTGLGAAGAVVLASCAKNNPIHGDGVPASPADLSLPVARPTIRLAGTDFGFPNPFGYTPPGYGRLVPVFDTLLWQGPKKILVPWLASKYQRNENGTLYNFELRDNIKWNDGKPLTVDDVVFSFDYTAEVGPPSQFIAKPEGKIKVTRTGERTFQIAVDKPTVTFDASVLAGALIVPKHIWQGVKDPAKIHDLKTLVGSGPYRLEKYEQGGSYLYTANDQFFLGKPFVKRMEFLQVGDEPSAVYAGEIDAGGVGTSGVTPATLKPFRNSRFGIVTGPPEFPAVLLWNQAKGGPLSDLQFRKACTLAIDRKDLVKRLFPGNAEPGNPGFLPPEHPFRVEVEQYPFDRAGAERMLDAAGYKRAAGGIRQGPDGKPLRFKLLAIPPLSAVTELVVGMLDKVGIKLDIEPSEFFQAFGPLSAGQYEMALIFYGGITGDPDYMRTVYSSRAQKPFHGAQGYKNLEFDDLADRQLVTYDEAERKKLIARMQQIVAADLPFLHLYYPRPILIYRRGGGFDQWDTGLNKQTFVTGRSDDTLKIRPTKA